MAVTLLEKSVENKNPLPFARPHMLIFRKQPFLLAEQATGKTCRYKNYRIFKFKKFEMSG